MDLSLSDVFTIQETSQIGLARRASDVTAQCFGFGDDARGRLALVINEAGNNLIRHGGGGCLIVKVVEDEAGIRVNVLALDAGPGMGNVDHYLQDGVSTIGTAGEGLGAIRRATQRFEIYSRPGGGTAISCSLARCPPRFGSVESLSVRSCEPAAGLWTHGAVRVAYPGEDSCGDNWATISEPDRELILIVDGLGHGLHASEAAGAAVAAFRQDHHGKSPEEILRVVDGALRSTRGAAAAVVELPASLPMMRYAGMGNTAGALYFPNGRQSFVSLMGTLGQAPRKFQEFQYDCPHDATIVLHTDGLKSQCSPEGYPGLLGQKPELIAGVLYRDFQRGRDDVTVIVSQRRQAI